MSEAKLIPLTSWIVRFMNGGDAVFHWGSVTEEEIESKLPQLIPLIKLSVHTWRILAYVAIGIDILLFFVMIYLIKNITKSIAIMKEASRVIVQLPSLLLYLVVAYVLLKIAFPYCLQYSQWLQSCYVELV